MAVFVLVCAPKGLEIGDDHKLHRANQIRALQAELTTILEPIQQRAAAQGCAIKFVEGAVIATIGDDVSIDSVDDRICVFQGNLKNCDCLAARYKSGRPHSPHFVRTSPHNSKTGSPSQTHSHDTVHPPLKSAASPAPPLGSEGPTSTPDTISTTAATASTAASPATGASAHVTPAQLILAMYEAEGAALLKRLQGRFSFVMYDAKQMRVLAARDGSGAVPLLQARTARDGLVIASHSAILTCCHDTLEFQPGFFKYGWHAEPRLFTPTDTILAPIGGVPGRRSIDHHHNGSHQPSHAQSAQARRKSCDAGGARAATTAVDATGLSDSQHGRPHGGHLRHSPPRNGGTTSVTVRAQRLSLDQNRPPAPKSATSSGGSPTRSPDSRGADAVPRSAGRTHGCSRGASARKDATKASLCGAAMADPRGRTHHQLPVCDTADGEHSHTPLNADAKEFIPGIIAAQ